MTLSTFSAAITYATSSYDIGISPQVIEQVESGEFDDIEDFDEELRNLYKEWIKHNRKVGSFNVYLFMIALLSSFDGIIFLLGSGIIGIEGHRFSALSIIMFLILSILLLIFDWIIWTADGMYARFGGQG